MRKTINAGSAYVRKRRANWLQVIGLAVFAAGGFVLAVWFGLFLAGAFLCVIGWAVDE
ncbi:hypothetical protein AB0B57_22300 [Micromonospora sp. NPDC049101]|uniref:hypothetical protein n=1 Tax=Micromonospora sp. NPDC049101 TaxID=3155032 RepID=UPI0033EB58C8